MHCDAEVTKIDKQEQNMHISCAAIYLVYVRECLNIILDGIQDVPALIGLTSSYLRGASDSYHNLAFAISVEIFFNEYLGSFIFKGSRSCTL